MSTDGGASSACLIGGTRLSTADIDLSVPEATLSGRVLTNGSRNGQSYFDIDCHTSKIESMKGQTLFALEGATRHGYPIRGIESIETGTRVFTKRDHQGFEARAAERWELPVTATV